MSTCYAGDRVGIRHSRSPAQRLLDPSSELEVHFINFADLICLIFSITLNVNHRQRRAEEVALSTLTVWPPSQYWQE